MPRHEYSTQAEDWWCVHLPHASILLTVTVRRVWRMDVPPLTAALAKQPSVTTAERMHEQWDSFAQDSCEIAVSNAVCGRGPSAPIGPGLYTHSVSGHVRLAGAIAKDACTHRPRGNGHITDTA